MVFVFVEGRYSSCEAVLSAFVQSLVAPAPRVTTVEPTVEVAQLIRHAADRPINFDFSPEEYIVDAIYASRVRASSERVRKYARLRMAS
jgi:hypothetical protein